MGYKRDAIFGGAYGHIWGGWLDLSLLWVAGAAELLRSLRKKGYGRNLLEAAEDEAKAQGCRGVFLSTSSFQARPFYERFGYEVIADVPDYPFGHTYHVLKENLQRA